MDKYRQRQGARIRNGLGSWSTFYRAEVYRTQPDDQGLAWLVLLELSHSTVTVAACSTEDEADQLAATLNAARAIL